MEKMTFVMEFRTPEKIQPLAPVDAQWEYETSDYPDFVRLTMEDGHVVTYRREIKQPGFVNAMELIGRMAAGYPRPGKHEKGRNL